MHPTDPLESRKSVRSGKSRVNLIVLTFEQLCNAASFSRRDKRAAIVTYRVYTRSFRLFRTFQLRSAYPTRLSVMGRNSIIISRTRNLYGLPLFIIRCVQQRLDHTSLSIDANETRRPAEALIRVDQFRTRGERVPKFSPLGFSIQPRSRHLSPTIASIAIIGGNGNGASSLLPSPFPFYPLTRDPRIAVIAVVAHRGARPRREG